jgi:hypothetical protein
MAVTPPDPVALMVAWLAAQPAITAVAGIAVADAPPGNLGTDVHRAITVQPVASPADQPAWNGPVVLWRPRLDVDAYAPDSTEAYNLANLVFGLLPDLRNFASEYGHITAVTVPSTPDFRPNFTERTFRWGGVCGLTMRAAIAT